jgi:short-subunit dehydrogenase
MDHRAIVITGASSGIGAALARRLARGGRTLGLVGRDAGRLEEVARACRSAGAVCSTAAIDVCDRARLKDFLTAFERQQPIDLVVANAGILEGRPLGQPIETCESARSVLKTNLLAAIDTVHAVLPAFRRRRRGDVVVVASLAAFVPLADAPAYSASKAGLMSYGLALRDALRDEGIPVVVACPGFVSTAMAKMHIGARPGEISAEVAAQRILVGLAKNRALVGFPTVPFWLTRLSLLAPEFLRRRGMRKTRFHVQPQRTPGAP